MNKKLLTLCVVHNHPRILLGMKKRGFGEGRWNGFGGKVDEGESIEAAAIRELKEECGLKADGLEKAGILEFGDQGNPLIHEVHVFRVNNFSGEPKESEEMKPQWFYLDEIPFSDMWPGDVRWFPMFFQDKKFKGKFIFDGTPENNIVEHFLEEVDYL